MRPKAMGRLAPMGDYVPTSCRAIEKAPERPTTLYDEIGCSPDAPFSEVRAKARRHMADSHPDAGGTAEGFMRAAKVYESFKTPEAKALYDAGVPNAGGPTITVYGEVEPRARVPCWWKPPLDLVDPNVGFLWLGMCSDAMAEAGIRSKVFSGVSAKGPAFWMEGGVMMCNARHARPLYARVLAMLKAGGFDEFPNGVSKTLF